MNSSESIKSNLASSQVVLGLAPTILSFAGSDITELAALSTYQPLLAILLSLGAPVLQIRHLFTPLDIASVVNKKPSQVVCSYYAWLTVQAPIVQQLFDFALHALGIGSIANHVATSLNMDSRAVVGFRCNSVLMPLVWGLLGVFPVAFTMLAAWQQYRLPIFTLGKRGKDARAERAGALTDESFEAPRRWISDALFSAAALAALLQLIYGTSILSAMTPISYLDALPVFARFVVMATLAVFMTRMRIKTEKAILRHSDRDRKLKVALIVEGAWWRMSFFSSV